MQPQVLSTWNQVAPRAYIRRCYCFPYADSQSTAALEQHLALALGQLSKSFPDLAGKVVLLADPRGHVGIDTSQKTDIPCHVSDERASFKWTYAQLKSAGFPAGAFVDPSFDLPHQLIEGQPGIPVFEVRARIISGGLLLCLYCHHSITDGAGMDNYVGAFAQLTRDPTAPIKARFPTDIHKELPGLVSHSRVSEATGLFYDLMGLCNEYCILDPPAGPTQFRTIPAGTPIEKVEKSGRTFVIGTQQINELKATLAKMPGLGSAGRGPSTYTCLAAITWAHVTKARLSSPNQLLSRLVNYGTRSETARLLMSIDWRRRAFTSTMEASGGNAIALPITEISTDTIFAACSGHQDVSVEALGTLARTINGAISKVDDGFIARRTAFMCATPDPRLIGVDVDPRDPTDFYFNTWRRPGSQPQWKVPGSQADAVSPDAIRRAQGDWNMGAGLFLPSVEEDGDFEVLITLDVDAMEVLCADPSWMKWVTRVIE